MRNGRWLPVLAMLLVVGASGCSPANDAANLSHGRHSDEIRLVEVPVEDRRQLLLQHVQNSPPRAGKLLLKTGLWTVPARTLLPTVPNGSLCSASNLAYKRQSGGGGCYCSRSPLPIPPRRPGSFYAVSARCAFDLSQLKVPFLRSRIRSVVGLTVPAPSRHARNVSARIVHRQRGSARRHRRGRRLHLR